MRTRHTPSVVQLLQAMLLAVLLLACGPGSSREVADSSAESPQDVLRANIAKALAVLTDSRYTGASRLPAQRERLCEIAREMFDPYLFSKLALGGHWKQFSASEQQAFVDSFAHYLCRYYLSRLQERYTGESVEYIDQTFKSAALATVKIAVLWENAHVPVDIKMAFRGGRWRAYDLVFMGVSAVMVYRTQFNDALASGSPAALIEELRSRTAGDG